MKFAEETKKTVEETKQEQVQLPKEESEERDFWLDAKYSDAPSDSDR